MDFPVKGVHENPARGLELVAQGLRARALLRIGLVGGVLREALRMDLADVDEQEVRLAVELAGQSV
jgi:hypothetical protein